MKTKLEALENTGMLEMMYDDFKCYEASVSFCKNKDLVWRWWLQQ